MSSGANSRPDITDNWNHPGTSLQNGRESAGRVRRALMSQSCRNHSTSHSAFEKSERLAVGMLPVI